MDSCLRMTSLLRVCFQRDDTLVKVQDESHPALLHELFPTEELWLKHLGQQLDLRHEERAILLMWPFIKKKKISAVKKMYCSHLCWCWPVLLWASWGTVLCGQWGLLCGGLIWQLSQQSLTASEGHADSHSNSLQLPALLLHSWIQWMNDDEWNNVSPDCNQHG